MRLGRFVLAATALLATGVFLVNTGLLAPARDGRPTLLAHRGLAQTFHREGLTGETCTAERIYSPEHDLLENSLPSMRAAFDAGADIVELDVHPTTDGHFAVFHDWTLDCRTEGSGVTREHTLAELKALDIGYGYTADGGRTHPFRGKGIGLMPTLDEVLAAFPERRFLINVKSNDASEGDLLAERLARLPPAQRERLMAYGGAAPIAALSRRLPELKVMSRETLKSCALRYIAVGWTGYVPQACRNTIVLVPVNYAWLLWGWPSRFVDRLKRAGTYVFATGPLIGGEVGTTGIDDEAGFRRLPSGYDGGIWTNRIDIIGRLVHTSAPRGPRAQ